MKKRHIEIIVFVLLCLGALLYFIFLNKKASQKVPNGNARYDIPMNEGEATQSAVLEKIKHLTSTDVNDQVTQIIHPFKSGAVFSIMLPSDPEATPGAMLGSIRGIQLTSKDYYMNILHLLNVDNSTNFCNSLAEKNMHSNLYANNAQKLPTKKANTYIWDLINQKGTLLQQINSCYKDGEKNVWIVDMYLSQPAYIDSYKDKIPSIFDSFTFFK